MGSLQYKNIKFYYFIFIIAIFIAGCGKSAKVTKVYPPSSKYPIPATQRPYSINGKTYYPIPSADGFVEEGYASWYGGDFHGKSTSNGERYNMHSMTAAHKILPMDTYVLVKNLENERQCVVRINDRGPFVKGRVIDLSYSSARQLGIVGKGLARVRVEAMGEVIDRDDGKRFYPHPDFRHGEFYVQVGAFLEPANAYSFKDRLEKRYKNVVVLPYMEGHRTYYRVQIFASNNYDEAKSLEMVLERDCNPEAFVVAR